MVELFSLPARQSSIALIVSTTLAGVVTVVLLTFAVLFYNAERERRWDELHQALAISADQLALAVALPAWNFDDHQVLAVMRSGLNHRDLAASVVSATANQRQYVLRRDARGQLVESAAPPAAPELLAEQRPVQMAGQEIGWVRVYATPAYVEDDLRQRRLAIIAVILVLDVALVLSVYLLLWHLMLKPLRAVRQYAATVEAGDSVGAAPSKAWFYGELLQLNNAIRGMINLLDSRFQALQMSEERLTIATRAANIGVWDWHIDKDELMWDEAMFRQYRIAPQQFGGGYHAWQEAVLPEDVERVSAVIAAALRGEDEYVAEYRIAWPDGTIRHIRAESQTTRDAHGKPIRMVGVSYDVTAARLAEQELLRHRNHLEELVAERTVALSVAVTEAKSANRAKSVFLATMSHELRTPLNSVIGFSHLMADSHNMSAEEKRNVAIIHRSGQHLLTLINDILELSKIEAGRVALQSAMVNLPQLLQEVLDMVSARARQSGLALALDCAGLPGAIEIDGAKLRQVLLNLLSNAVKFVDQGGVTLEVRATPLAGQRHALRFAVRDSGVGIAPADQARIFEPFVQAGHAGTTEGTGLGLAISREFVRMLGGKLEVESELGVGSVFRFTLEVDAGASVPEPVAADVVALDPGQRGRRILLVDDSEDGRRLMASLLAPFGFALFEAADGEAALAAIVRERPELVFMDWRMPGLDGLEVTRRVRADAALSQPRVVILTASAFEEERQQALAAGADGFLRKPIEHDKLLRVLEEQLELRLQRRRQVVDAVPGGEVAPGELALLPLASRAALRTALQELNLALVEQLLMPVRREHAALAAAIERMLEQHQYRQLCALLDALHTGDGSHTT
ncbi:MAG: ATP-binding protein [Pseudomonadota bacterium]